MRAQALVRAGPPDSQSDWRYWRPHDLLPWLVSLLPVIVLDTSCTDTFSFFLSLSSPLSSTLSPFPSPLYDVEVLLEDESTLFGTITSSLYTQAFGFSRATTVTISTIVH